MASALCVITAVLSYVLPGRSAERQSPLTEEVVQMMEEEGEVGATGLSLAEEVPVSIVEEPRP